MMTSVLRRISSDGNLRIVNRAEDNSAKAKSEKKPSIDQKYTFRLRSPLINSSLQIGAKSNSVSTSRTAQTAATRIRIEEANARSEDS